ncbi:prolipoprotein diacylglyceryl transferase [bacterium]|nr:prolipoprotein diacylglyceryl transferase [bacterium]
MFPKLFSFKTPEFLSGYLPAEITVYSYGVMIALGVLASFYVGLKKSRHLGMDADKLASLFLWSIAAAFVGGKLFFYFEDFNKYLNDPAAMLSITGGGFVFYGSLIFTVPTIVWRLKKEKIAVRPFLDELAFIGPIIHSFGRVGCFLAGCCHGKVCDSPIGVTFSHPSSLAKPQNVPLYPTQLFDIGVNIIILLLVIAVERKKKFEGQLFLIYLALYAIGRSIVEIYRGDEARGFVFGGALSHSQFIAILIFCTCLYFWKQWSRSTEH